IDIPAQAIRFSGPSIGCLIYVTGGAYRTATVNNVYAIWHDLSGEANCTLVTQEPGTNVNSTCKTRIWFNSSNDGGQTWNGAVMINNQSSKNDQFFPRLAVDDTTGDLMVVYYDTVNDPNRVSAEIWTQYSTDGGNTRSEEHTSEPQSLTHLVCRLLLEKKKNQRYAVINRSSENARNQYTNPELIY